MSAATALTMVLALAFGLSPDQASSFDDLLRRVADAPAELRAPAIFHYLNLAGSAPLVEGDTIIFLAEADAGRPPRIVGNFNAWGKNTPPDPALSGAMTRINGTESALISEPLRDSSI